MPAEERARRAELTAELLLDAFSTPLSRLAAALPAHMRGSQMMVVEQKGRDISG